MTYLQKSLQAGPEQVLYAKVLEKGMLIGLLTVVVTYVIYVTGILKPYVPTSQITKCWQMSVNNYLDTCNIHAGWTWIYLIGYGDFLNYVGITILAGVTIVCFISIVPTLWRQNDRLYAAFAILEVIILSVAASGILSSGGH